MKWVTDGVYTPFRQHNGLSAANFSSCMQVCEEMGDYESVREDLEKMVPGASTTGQFAMSLVRREQEVASESNRCHSYHHRCYCSSHSKTLTLGGAGSFSKAFLVVFLISMDFKCTRVMLHWIGLVESFPNLVSNNFRFHILGVRVLFIHPFWPQIIIYCGV